MRNRTARKALRQQIRVEQERARLARHEKRFSWQTRRAKAATRFEKLYIRRSRLEVSSQHKKFTEADYLAMIARATAYRNDQLKLWELVMISRQRLPAKDLTTAVK